MWRAPHIWAFFRHSHNILCVARAVGNLMDGNRSHLKKIFDCAYPKIAERLTIYRVPPKNPPEKPLPYTTLFRSCGKAQYRVEMPMHPTRFTSCGAHRIYGHFSGIATAYCVSQGPSGI